MADDDLELEEKKPEDVDEGEDGAEGKGKAKAKSKASKKLGKKKLIIIAAAVAALLLGGGVVLYLTMGSSPKAEASGDDEGEGEADAPEEQFAADDLLSTGSVVRLDTLLVNLADADARRFARVRIEIVFPVASEATRIEESKVAMARVHDVALSLLSTKSSDELDAEGRAELRAELKKVFRAALAGAQVVDVLITDFIVQ
jgi:flagellar FliL protein